PMVLRELGSGQLRQSPIATKYVRSLHLNMADLAHRAERTLIVYDPDGHPGERYTDGTCDALPAIAVEWVRSQDVCLAHTVALQQRVPCASPKFVEGLR